jgi:hypothetical protein
MARRKIRPDEPARVVGGKVFVRREDEVTIGEFGDWIVVNVPGWGKDGWRSLKIFRNVKGPKNLWQIGVKEGSHARNRAAKLLEQYYPGVIDRVVEIVVNWENTVEKS